MTRNSQFVWACNSSFLETALIGAGTSEAQSVSIVVRDPFGALANSMSVTVEPGSSPQIFDTAPLMVGVGLESGLQHALLEVVGYPRIFTRYTSLGGSAVCGALNQLEGEQAFCQSTLQDSLTSSMLVLANPLTDVATNARVRWIVRGRAPETVLNVPAGGVRVVILEQLFADIATGLEPGAVGYVRVSPRETPLLVRGIQRRGPVEGDRYTIGVM